MAPSSRKACCTGWRCPFFASPSTVVMGDPTASDRGVMHECTGTPFSRTVQAPHSDSPHPNLVPVRPKSSRRTSNQLVSGSASTWCFTPFTINCTLMAHLKQTLPDLRLLVAGRWQQPGSRFCSSPWTNRDEENESIPFPCDEAPPVKLDEPLNCAKEPTAKCN